MKTFLSAGAVLALLASPVLADNQRGPYVGVGAVMVSGDSRTPYDKAEMPALELSAGYKYNGLLGVEGRIGLGVNDDRDDSSDYFVTEQEDNASLSEIGREVDQYAAVYYRPELINQKARLYGLLGYAQLETVVTRWEGNSSETTDDSLSGSSYGLGVGWYVTDHLNFNAEYRQLANTDDNRFETLSLQFDYRF